MNTVVNLHGAGLNLHFKSDHHYSNAAESHDIFLAYCPTFRSLWEHFLARVSLCVSPSKNFRMPELMFMKIGMDVMPPDVIPTA
jgi:hypothetical protein